MFQLQRVGLHGSIMPKIKTVKQLRGHEGRGLRGPEVHNYNRGKGHGGRSVSCQTNAFQEKSIPT